MREAITVEALATQLELLQATVIAKDREVKSMITAQNTSYAARCLVDDKRDEKMDKRLDDLNDRVDAHGKRTTALETLVTAFFGEQGAFRLIVKKLDENGDKLDAQSDKLEDFKESVSAFNIKVLLAVSAGTISIIGAVVVWLVEKTHS